MRNCFSYIGSILGLLLSAFLISSCSEPDSLHDKLKGDWVSKYYHDGWSEKRLVFSFEDSSCLNSIPYGEKAEYALLNDTFIICEKRGYEKRIKESSFKILKLNSDILVITSIADSIRKLDNYKIFTKSNKVRLKKLKKRNNFKFKNLAFFRGLCYFDCTAFYLEIDKYGNFIFNGIQNTLYDGFHSGKIQLSDYNNILQKVNQLNLDSLEERYYAHWGHDQTCGVKIQFEDNSIESKAYGYYKEPIELRILFYYLMNLYHDVELTKNPSVEKKLFFREFYEGAFPRLFPPTTP